jgi:5-methylcytosine-specific restriction protein A
MPIINQQRKQEKRKYESSKRDNLNTKAVYNTGTWRKLRLLFLSEHPLCDRCIKVGKINSAIDVHHIIPINLGKTLTEKRTLGFDYNNLEGLCRDCHKEHHRNKKMVKNTI